MHIFKEELELLKNKLKVLDVDVFGKIVLGLEESIEELNILDRSAVEECIILEP